MSVNSNVIVWKHFPEPIAKPQIISRHSGELEEGRKVLIKKFVDFLLPTAIFGKLTFVTGSRVFAEGTKAANDIRDGFMDILDVFTAIAEPILWFYALTACIMMATKNKDAGWQRLKQVGYAYAGIALLPTFFAFLRWMAELLKGAVSF